MKTSRVSKAFCYCAILFVIASSLSSAKEDRQITGTWVVNEEETDKLQNRVRRSNTANRNVAGDIVGTNISGPVGPNSTLRFPIVLECEEVTFEVEDTKVKASCETGVSRVFLLGKLHGRVTRFRQNILTESYSSTSRSVKHDIRVNKHGNLIAEVKIKPKDGVAQTYVRVYSRPTDDIESKPDEATEESQTES